MTALSSPTTWREDLRAALPGWVAARVITLVALGVAALARPHWPVALPPTERFARGGLLGWDADWYRRIALDGYDGVPEQGLRFFPLLPEVARIAGFGTSIGVGFALLVLANGPALGVGALASRLVRVEGGDADLGRLAATLVALAPPAFVLVMGYTEAIALCALLGGILAARRGWWWAACGCGLVAGLARPTGVLLAVPLAVLAVLGPERPLGAGGAAPERPGGAGGAGPEGSGGAGGAGPEGSGGAGGAGSERPADGGGAGPERPGGARMWQVGWGERARRVVAVVSPAVGAAPYLLWAHLDRGDWYAPYRVQSMPGLRGSFVDPFTRVWRALATLAGGGVGVDAHDLWVPVALVLLVPAVRRWSPALASLAVVTTVVAISAENLGSFERYVWASIVPVLTVAWLCRGALARRVAPVVAGAGMAVLATLAFLGYYVP